MFFKGKRQSYLGAVLVFILVLAGLLGPGAGVSSGQGQGAVYFLPVHETIDYSLAKFLKRAYQEAESQGAAGVILDINTPGGLIDAAVDIKDAIGAAKVKTVALVNPRALSAGALLALANQQIYMVPGATMGAAQPVVGGTNMEPAGEKVVSYWAAELGGTAERNGRNAKIAAAMADQDLGYPGLVEPGKLLTLTAEDAVKWGMADGVVSDRGALLEELGLGQATVVEMQPSFADKLAGWLTNPYVSVFLLTLGLAGIFLEFITVGWGVAGTIGILCLSLYFAGPLVTGQTGWEAVLLFILGLVAMLIEILFIPGFGLAGILGLGLMVASIFVASVSVAQAIASLTVALIGTILLMAIGLRFLTKRHLWNRFVLQERQENQGGYTAPQGDLSHYLGMEGRALTTLRPAGTAQFGEERVDVVTEGEFIPVHTPVKVVKVEGVRVVVRALRAEE